MTLTPHRAPWHPLLCGLAAALTLTLAAGTASADPGNRWPGQGGNRGSHGERSYGGGYSGGGHGDRAYGGSLRGGFDHGRGGRSGWSVRGLPALQTLVVVGGLAYLVANGRYYRERDDGGYDAVPVPMVPASPVYAAPAEERLFVYPRHAQTPAQQAADEYDCHRWAAGQTGFDPTAQATGQNYGYTSTGRRTDYERARAACLDGRGYTLR